MSMNLESDMGIVRYRDCEKASKSKLPIICFRDGRPPLPDASNIALTGSVNGILACNDTPKDKKANLVIHGRVDE
ncbi:hypothetical protein FRX31_010854, partial [Thalictrum thalictroides]